MKIQSIRNLKRCVLAALSGAAFTFSVSAQATLIDGIVDVWNVNVATVFDTNSICDSTGDCTAPTGVTVVNNQSLRWGSGGSGPSGLDISASPSNQNVNTNGAAVPNVSVTHLNRPITGTTLSSVNIDSTLTLTPFIPPATGLAAHDACLHCQLSGNAERGQSLRGRWSQRGRQKREWLRGHLHHQQELVELPLLL